MIRFKKIVENNLEHPQRPIFNSASDLVDEHKSKLLYGKFEPRNTTSHYGLSDGFMIYVDEENRAEIFDQDESIIESYFETLQKMDKHS